MLSDLAALTPPFLMAGVFLFAVAAFIRHEMRAGNKQDGDQGDDGEEATADDQIGDRGSEAGRH